MESSTTIGDIANRLKMSKQTQGTTALFLGAKAGGLFRALQLYSTLDSFGLSDLVAIERYHQCYEVLCGPFFNSQDLHNILTDKMLLREIKVEMPELCIAELSKRGLFNPILSVSIYKEFEEALHQVGMKEILDFVVVWPKSSTSATHIHTEKRNVFTLRKVFGDIASGDYNIRGRVRHLTENKDLEKVVTGLRDVNILIVGADQIWDQHVIGSLFPHSPGGVWYVNDEEPAKGSSLLECLEDCNAEYILGADGQYENFFKSLYWHVIGAVPSSPATMEQVQGEPEESQNAIQKLVTEIRDLRGEIAGLTERVTSVLNIITS